MCEPISAGTLAAISIGSTILSTGVGLLGRMKQQEAAAAQHGYQAAVMRNNAQIADLLAADARERGQVAEDRQRAKMRQILGAQTAALAGQGTDLTRSESSILGDTAAAGELDALTIRSNAAREAWGSQARASQFAAESQRPLLGASGLGVGASLLSGVGSVADKWYRFYSPGRQPHEDTRGEM